ncbi:hypothetical protein FDP41_011805 [Naegleria fowleri]|uniref:Rab-GAP TBC domain-containing protein n=1 Tax=Naegleria fowleri TaxID=5763 RepID=A0A6A5C638_NAEFO|nr:uncharacterized protein FDP41_011805 [Naegleria fowleri]KAF0981944.1 hypothetical protein FDP41_011805 [Naegleria fowleri]
MTSLESRNKNIKTKPTTSSTRTSESGQNASARKESDPSNLITNGHTKSKQKTESKHPSPNRKEGMGSFPSRPSKIPKPTASTRRISVQAHTTWQESSRENTSHSKPRANTGSKIPKPRQRVVAPSSGDEKPQAQVESNFNKYSLFKEQDSSMMRHSETGRHASKDETHNGNMSPIKNNKTTQNEPLSSLLSSSSLTVSLSHQINSYEQSPFDFIEAPMEDSNNNNNHQISLLQETMEDIIQNNLVQPPEQQPIEMISSDSSSELNLEESHQDTQQTQQQNSQVITINDFPMYSDIFNLSKQGKDKELFKYLADLSQMTSLLTSTNGEAPKSTSQDEDSLYEEAYNKFMNKGVFARLIVKPHIKTLKAIDPETGNTALHIALLENQTSTASLLCKCRRSDSPSTSTNSSVENGQIDSDFMNIDQYNFNKETALHIATLKNFSSIAHVLVLNGSKAFNIPDAQGRTALQLAAIYEREQIAHSMCEYGGDICEMYDDSIIRMVNTDELKNIESKPSDRYGFFVENPQNKWTITDKEGHPITEYVSIDSVKQPSLFHELYKRRMKEEKRLKKWKSMFAEIKEKHTKGDLEYLPKKFKERVRKGEYFRLKKKPLSAKDAKQIDVDIKREFREHRLFAYRYSKHQVSLFNLLRAYCNYNTRLGYTQGMSSIAAMLLMYLSEEDAFWTFCSIMESDHYNMQEMYFSGLPGVNKATYVFSHILSKRMKKFMKTFENNEHGIRLDAFCTRWYMLNMLTQIHFDVAVLVWDLFLSEGNKVIHSVTVAFMRLFKRQLNKSKCDESAMLLNHLIDTDFDLEKLMRKTLKSKIKEKTIRSLEQEYEQKQK